MKNFLKFAGILALAVIIGFGLVSCQETKYLMIIGPTEVAQGDEAVYKVIIAGESEYQKDGDLFWNIEAGDGSTLGDTTLTNGILVADAAAKIKITVVSKTGDAEPGELEVEIK